MLILVTGGAASGKSALAEELAQRLGGKMLYLATMEPFGEDAQRRIARHRALRAGKGFDTLEWYADFAHLPVPTGYDTVLVECMGNAVAGELFSPKGAKNAALSSILAGIERLQARCCHVVVVTNEVFSDGVSYAPETMEYIRVLGDVNAKLAQRADAVLESVCGLPWVYRGAEQMPVLQTQRSSEGRDAMTVLIVGGAAQGKTAFAKQAFPNLPMVLHLERCVRDCMEQGKPLPTAANFHGKAVLCDEIGMGIVPLDKGERDWREAVGRLCCELAAQADAVYRVSCGIPIPLKGGAE